MVAFQSYLADLTDPTFLTREVDMNGFEVGNGPFETDPNTFDLGAPPVDGVWLSEAGKDEDVLSAKRRGRVQASFDLRLAPGVGTLDNLTIYLRRLNAALDRSGVWVLQQPGASTPLYIDYYPSDLIQQLMPGQRSLYFLWKQLQQPNGMRVTILRRPKMRGAALDASLNLAHNGTLAEDHDADGTPTFWQWDSITGMSGFEYDWTFGAHRALLNTGAAHFFYQDADADLIEAAHTYTFAADVAGTYSLLPRVRCRIDWFDVDSNPISTSYGTATTLLFSPRVDFLRVTIKGAVAPTGAVSARYGVEVTPASTATVTFYVRDGQFQTGVAASDFRAGFETISQNPGDAFYKRIWLKNNGNADALGQIRATPSVGHEVARLVYARRSGARDSAMAMRSFGEWSAAASDSLLSGTTSTTDGGRTVALTDLDSDVMRPLIRNGFAQAEESAERGTWRWRVSLRGTLDDAYAFELRYGIGDVGDLPRTMTRRQLDLTAPPDASDYYAIDLDLMRIPANAPGVFVELWGMRVTTDDGAGTGELYIDQLWPEPADDDLYAIASVPGAQRSGSGPITETVIGRKLITPPDGLADDPDTSDPFEAGSIYNDDLLLNDLLEACSLKAGATADLTPGVEHTYIADVTMFTASEKVARIHGELRVHNLTDDVHVKKVVIKNVAGEPWCDKSVPIRFTPATGKAYLVYVVQTVANTVGNIHVTEIHHSFTPPIEGGTDTIAIDADQRRAYVLNGDGQFVDDLDLVPPFPTLMPKVQLLRVSAAGLGSDGSDSVLDDGPALSHDPDLTIEFGVHVVPRYFN